MDRVLVARSWNREPGPDLLVEHPDHDAEVPDASGCARDRPRGLVEREALGERGEPFVRRVATGGGQGRRVRVAQPCRSGSAVVVIAIGGGKVRAFPAPSTAAQKSIVGHDTALSALPESMVVAPDQLVPS